MNVYPLSCKGEGERSPQNWGQGRGDVCHITQFEEENPVPILEGCLEDYEHLMLTVQRDIEFLTDLGVTGFELRITAVPQPVAPDYDDWLAKRYSKKQYDHLAQKLRELIDIDRDRLSYEQCRQQYTEIKGEAHRRLDTWTRKTEISSKAKSKLLEMFTKVCAYAYEVKVMAHWDHPGNADKQQYQKLITEHKITFMRSLHRTYFAGDVQLATFGISRFYTKYTSTICGVRQPTPSTPIEHGQKLKTYLEQICNHSVMPDLDGNGSTTDGTDGDTNTTATDNHTGSDTE